MGRKANSQIAHHARVNVGHIQPMFRDIDDISDNRVVLCAVQPPITLRQYSSSARPTRDSIKYHRPEIAVESSVKRFIRNSGIIQLIKHVTQHDIRFRIHVLLSEL